MNSKTKKSTKTTILTFIIVAVIIGISIYGLYLYNTLNGSNFQTEKNGYRVYVYPGTTINQFTEELDSAKVLINKKTFQSWAKRMDAPDTIPVGSYIIENESSNKHIIRMITLGLQKPVKVIIHNIRMQNRLAQRLSRQLLIDSTTIHNAIKDTTLQAKYGFNDNTIIGMFIPNTYNIMWNVSAETLLDRFHDEYTKFWNPTRLEKAKEAGLSPIEVITLASIVDEETNVKNDKPIIAGLYLNRLRKGIPLQACPTAKYAVGDFSITHVLFKHINFISPYNTYINKGLPPGPIRIPSIEGIDAVLNYTQSNYLFMCAKETLNGEHSFAATLSEHNKNAARYHKALREYQRKKLQEKKLQEQQATK